MNGLTESQKALLRAVMDLAQRQEQPNCTTIGEALGVSRETVRAHLKRIEHKGYVQLAPSTKGGVKVVRDPNGNRVAMGWVACTD